MIGLSDPLARDERLTGTKAANLARAATAGLSTLPGFVLTTAAFEPDEPGWPGRVMPQATAAAVRAAWHDLGGETVRTVVRSSSTAEDVGSSSMAGQFRSHLGVVGWPALEAAIRDVQRSAARAGARGSPDPMAVLVQRMVDAEIGGVLFGVEPVTGDRQHLVVEVVPGGPEALVSGTGTAQRYLLGRRGRVIQGPPDAAGPELLDRRSRSRLARLAAATHRHFGCEQDVEWAIDRAGHLWLLQSRPVTAVGSADVGSGPVLGPGPLAETFPDALRPLEEELWLAPLREGIVAALALVGAVPARTLAGSPVVTTVGGRVACDLELLRASPAPPSRWRWLDPRVTVRKLASSWRSGRLRAALPSLAADMCRRVDAELSALGAPEDLDDAELFELIGRTRRYLVPVHGHEILAGALLPQREGMTGTGIAMSVVHRGRALGLSDPEIVERWPVALALTAPRIGSGVTLPPVIDLDDSLATAAAVPRVADLPPREALRLRGRWLQELSAVAAAELATRLADTRRIPSAGSLAHLRLVELEEIVSGWPAPTDLGDRTLSPGPALPSMFRLGDQGSPVAIRLSGSHRSGGTGAAQGRAQGSVVHDPTGAQPGDILVTRTLDPRYAGWLPVLGGIVSETGGVLSHLAILAREYEVPTVVGVHDAVGRFPSGSLLVVDGTSGEVQPLQPGGIDGGGAP